MIRFDQFREIGQTVTDMEESSKNIERENRILDAATDLILHYGYDKTTVSDIAREAGVSKGAIYLHFPSKEAIIDGLIQRDISRSLIAMIDILDRPDEEWDFVSMYKKSLIVMNDFPVLTALVRGDSRFGSYFKKTSLDLLRLKQRSRLPMLTVMQEAGALRDDLDMRHVDAILSLLGYGYMNREESELDMHGISDNALVEAIGGMMESWLVPVDGGNRQAAHQIIMGFIKQFRASLTNDDDKSTGEP